MIDSITDIAWQQSGQTNMTICANSDEYICKLNLYEFAGHGDWRIPTPEEVKLISELREKNHTVVPNPISSEVYLWCPDKEGCRIHFSGNGDKHSVMEIHKDRHYFDTGDSYNYTDGLKLGCVRAVRSGN